jgi:hypothetical protein
LFVPRYAIQSLLVISALVNSTFSLTQCFCVGTSVVFPQPKALNASIDNSAFTISQPQTVGSKVTELTSGNCTTYTSTHCLPHCTALHYSTLFPAQTFTRSALYRESMASTPIEAIDASSVTRKLQALAASGIKLCRRSERLLASEDDSTAQAYITAWRGRAVVTPPFVTAMVTLSLKYTGALNLDAAARAKIPSTIVVATEAQGILLLNNTNFTVTKEWYMDSVASMMCTHGGLFTIKASAISASWLSKQQDMLGWNNSVRRSRTSTSFMTCCAWLSHNLTLR